MSEKPILFSAPMVRAILDGTKIQTRRVIKPQPDEDGLSRLISFSTPWMDTSERVYKCPYGKPGDHLWVKETFWAWGWWEKLPGKDKKSKPRWKFLRDVLDETGDESVIFEPPQQEDVPTDRTHLGYHKRPSIFMPRAASRILLRVTDIRVERVGDITPADAKMEGDKERSGFPEFFRRGAQCYVDWFRTLWDSINAKRGFDWKSNPWVWAVTFERMEVGK